MKNLMAKRLIVLVTCCLVNLSLFSINAHARRLQKVPQAKSNQKNCNIKGMAHGDPHFVTFDQVRYDYHGLGEFVLAKAKDKHVQVHVRHERIREGSNIAVITGIAIRLGKDQIKFYLNRKERSKKDQIIVNGKKIPRNRKRIQLSQGVLHQAPSHYLVETQQGESIYWDGSYSMINVKMNVCDPQKYTGLLMPKSPKNTTANADQDTSLVYANRGPKSFKKKNKMLKTPQGSDPFVSLNHHKERKMNDEKAKKVCQSQGLTGHLLESCILDVALTGKASFAKTAVKMSKNPMAWVKEYSLSHMSVKQWRRKMKRRLPSMRRLKKMIRKVLHSKKIWTKAKNAGKDLGRHVKVGDSLKQLF